MTSIPRLDDGRAGRAARSHATRVHHIDVLGIPLTTGPFEDVTQWMVATITDAADRPSPHIITHVNVANFHSMATNDALRRAMIDRTTMLFDGIGMKVAARITGHPWLPDQCGTDLFPAVMDHCRSNGVRVFCLGSRPDVAAAAACALADRWPGVRAAGSAGGYFDAADEHDICSTIRDSRSDLLLVGRGFGRQEDFALRNVHRLGVRTIWTVGALLEYISDTTPRAPAWMRCLRLEWLYRFGREPKRMFYRNCVSAPWVLWRACRHAWSQR